MDEKELNTGELGEKRHSTSSIPSQFAKEVDGDLEAGPHDDAVATAKTSDSESRAEPDPNIVDWDGPDDPAHPMNWPAWKKWAQILFVSAFAVLTPLASSMFAPGVPSVLKEFHNDNTAIATFVVSVYILGYAVGPFILAPASEMYGRIWMYHISNVLYVAFTIGCALSQSIGQLIAFRFLAGTFGATPMTIGGGTIADLVPLEKRGAAMSIWSLGPLAGPVIGPIAGGFLSAAEGWRWIFWVLTIAMGLLTVGAMIFMRESYAPVLLARKTKRLQKETGNMALRSKLALDVTGRQLFFRGISRPIKLLFVSPICLLLSIYMAVVYGTLYLLFTTFTFVFEGKYGFSQAEAGLSFIALGIGMFIGVIVMGLTADPLLIKLKNKYGAPQPEFRLPPAIFGAPFLPIGMFLYGWTAQFQVQWAVPMFGTLLVGIGMISVFMCIAIYLVDAFTLYAASALGANAFLRSVLGACFPLFGLSMYDKLGLGWGNSLIAFILLALCPLPYLFYVYGEKIRQRFPVRL